MDAHGDLGAEIPDDRVDLSELDDAFQLLASGSSGEQVESIAELFAASGTGGGDDEESIHKNAALLLRLAKHYSDRPPEVPIAADGHVIPKQIGRFSILREIGSGGFGVIYLARDEAIGRDVAIKLPRRDLIQDAVRRKQMIHEARTAGSLEHPGIIPIYESGCEGETVYLVSSYCEGPDLATWLGSQTERPSVIEIASFVSRLADAVAYAHGKGVIHRDIKPSNVLLALDVVGPDVVGPSESRSLEATATSKSEPPQSVPLSAYRPRLTDFGLAKFSDEPIVDTRSSLIIGTPLYMAPEQLLPDLGPITFQTDIYSIGVLLVELIDGKPPLSGKTYVEILSFFQDEPRKSIVYSDIPSDLRTIIDKCLSRTPENRYASADALSVDLAAFAAGETISARKMTWITRARVWCRDARRTREACVSTVAAMSALIVWVLYSISLVMGPWFPGDDPWTPAIQALAIIACINLPVLVLAVLGLRRKIWAMKVAMLLLLTGGVFVPLLIIGDFVGLLDPIYGPFPYFKKSFHALVLLISLSEAIYLSIGIYANRWNWKRHRPAKMATAR
ncbi:Serine/threonine-protein kinase PrkC [Novipirellula aureliae]|uniref:Serine/threonine-protein kinase PrkC n=2 Tax=Novipirellula aureliae TaxID=2527966 RepID=A0A5C6DI80_9BACT|nr:Serine/threonine-protein kinase PrkC [Novipirellula aureliae]